jgi:hypothetical protein
VIISLYNISRPVFITETQYVYCAVRTDQFTFLYVYMCNAPNLQFIAVSTKARHFNPQPSTATQWHSAVKLVLLDIPDAFPVCWQCQALCDPPASTSSSTTSERLLFSGCSLTVPHGWAAQCGAQLGDVANSTSVHSVRRAGKALLETHCV